MKLKALISRSLAPLAWLLFAFGLCYFLVISFLSAPYDPPTDQEPLKLYSRICLDDLQKPYLEALHRLKHGRLFMFSLSSKDLRLLISKRLKDSDFKVLYDKKYGSSFKRLSAATPHPKSGLMHMKALTCNHELSLFGSANLTPSSLKKDHNLVIAYLHPPFASFLNQHFDQGRPSTYKDKHLEAYILPKHPDALPRLIQLIEESQKCIQVAMYTFTHIPLAQALLKAKNRGVKVEVILDRKQAKSSSHQVIATLVEGKLAPRYLPSGEVNHHKFMLVDKKLLCCGSCNWTKGAFEKNKELLAILTLNKKQQAKMQRLYKRLRVLSASS